MSPFITPFLPFLQFFKIKLQLFVVIFCLLELFFSTIASFAKRVELALHIIRNLKKLANILLELGPVTLFER